MSITYNYEDNITIPLSEEALTRWILSVIDLYRKDAGPISFIFCNDEYLLAINIAYLKHDYYTDVITFDYCEDNIVSGDIFISVDTVLSNSEEYSVGYVDELKRVIIHGILHLLGHNDHTEADDLTMREAEDAAILLFNSNYSLFNETEL